MTVTPPPPPQAVPPPKKGGCLKWALIGCLAALVLAAIGACAIVMIVFGAIKSSDAYRGALATTQKDPRVIAALGAPVRAGFWVAGNVSVDAEGGQADFQFPVSGANDEGRVHAVATRDTTGWHYKVLTMRPRHGPPIDLLQP